MFEAIAAYFAWLATFGPMAMGFIPVDSPIAPPGPTQPPAIRASSCGPSYVAPGVE